MKHRLHYWFITTIFHDEHQHLYNTFAQCENRTRDCFKIVIRKAIELIPTALYSVTKIVIF